MKDNRQLIIQTLIDNNNTKNINNNHNKIPSNIKQSTEYNFFS